MACQVGKPNFSLDLFGCATRLFSTPRSPSPLLLQLSSQPTLYWSHLRTEMPLQLDLNPQEGRLYSRCPQPTTVNIKSEAAKVNLSPTLTVSFDQRDAFKYRKYMFPEADDPNGCKEHN